MSTELAQLERTIGYQFTNSELLQRAVTHRSYAKDNNERLEFLGDSILNFTIAAKLFDHHQHVDEGDLSRLRAHLVDKPSLAIIAKTYNLGVFMRLGGGELKTGGWRRESIIADAVEAIIGAVYKDGGIKPAQALIERFYQERLQNLPDLNTLKDPKTRLQEYLQSQNQPIPQYAIVSVTGKAHEQKFTVECAIPSPKLTVTAEGTSRRKAEQAAAEAMLSRLNQPPTGLSA